MGGQLAPIPPRAWSSALPAPEEASGAAGAAGLRRGCSAGARLRVRTAGGAARSERVGPAAAGRLVRSARRCGPGRGRAAVGGGSSFGSGFFSLPLRTRKGEAAVRALGACPGSLAARRLRSPFPARYVPSRAARCVLARFISEMPSGRSVRLFLSAARSSERFCLRAALSGFAFAGNRLKFSESARCFFSYLASVCEPAAPLCFRIAEGRSVPLNSAQNFSSGRRRGCTGLLRARPCSSSSSSTRLRAAAPCRSPPRRPAAPRAARGVRGAERRWVTLLLL